MATTGAGSAPGQADVLVIFGITGDLAKVMTFHALYRLEQRGLLDCPIVGVAFEEWSRDQLVARARESVAGDGEVIDEDVFARLAGRLDYVPGDFGKAETYAALAAKVGDPAAPVFYLETPPSLFATVVKGLSEAGLTRNGRVVVEKPFGHDLASARALAAELHAYVREDQILRLDHYLGKLGLEEILFLRFANTMLEPVWNRNHIDCVQITMLEDFGVETRGRFYDPVGALRDVVVNHLMQVLGATAMEAPSGRDPSVLNDAMAAVFRGIRPADPAHCIRGQYRGYREISGVAPDSRTETYVALRLEIDSWRWSGVPFFIRAGKRLAVTQTEVRIVFKAPPKLGFARLDANPIRNQVVVKLDPETGIRMVLDARRDGAIPGEAPVHFEAGLPQLGGKEATPYEVLLHAALRGDHSRFTRQDGIEEAWRVFQPILDDPPPVIEYDPGSWGPAEAKALVHGHGGWVHPWIDG